MHQYYEGRVVAADIDNLGHMNVRIYAQKAALATHALAASLGLDVSYLEKAGKAIHMPDTHTRFYREQLEGAQLAVRGGVLSADNDEIVVYLELYNLVSQDIAATFRTAFILVDRWSRKPKHFPPEIITKALDAIVDWPEHGQPRSLPLEAVDRELTLGNVQAQGYSTRFDPFTVEPDDCDEYGYMDLSTGLSLPFAKMPIKFKRRKRSDDAGGGDVDGFWSKSRPRTAIATVESRQSIIANPRLGDSVVTYSAHLNVTKKSLNFCHWSFNEKTGQLFSIETEFGLAFDLEKRKSTTFPADMRAKLKSHGHPALD